jgi:hypothetical protein
MLWNMKPRRYPLFSKSVGHDARPAGRNGLVEQIGRIRRTSSVEKELLGTVIVPDF